MAPFCSATLVSSYSALDTAGNAREALPLLEAALPVEKTLWSDETVPVARAYDALGRTENALGNRKEARTYFQKALAGYRKLFPDGSDSTATALYHLATTDYEDHLYPAAEMEVDEAIALNTKVLGPNDLYTLRSVLMSGLILEAEHQDAPAHAAFASVCSNSTGTWTAEVRSRACAEVKKVGGG